MRNGHSIVDVVRWRSVIVDDRCWLTAARLIVVDGVSRDLIGRFVVIRSLDDWRRLLLLYWA